MMYYVVMDIGCEECGGDHSCVGLFTNAEEAQRASDEAEATAKAARRTERYFYVFATELTVSA